MLLYFILGFLYEILSIKRASAETDPKKCIKWGGQFDVPLRSQNVRKDCALPDGRAVCCAAVFSNISNTEDEKSSRGIGYGYEAPRSNSILVKEVGKKIRCDVTKVYISSPQEERDLHKSAELEKIIDQQQRLDSLLKYVTSDEMMANSTKWLARVKIHMNSEVIPRATDEDRYV
jgi:putative hemolysin